MSTRSIKRARSLSVVGAVALLAGSAIVIAPFQVTAVHDEMLFELEGDAEEFNNPPPPFGPTEDAETIYNAAFNGGTTNADAFDFVEDGVDGDGPLADDGDGNVIITPPDPGCPVQQCDDIFTGGGSKDDLDMTQWLWTLSKPQPKDEITHGFAASYDKDGDTFVYFGGSRWSNDGAAHIGLWLLKNEVCFDDPDNDGSGNFGCEGGTAQHEIGDVLVLSNFTGGGANATQSVYQWVGGTNGDEDGDGDLDGPLDLVNINADCDTAPPGDQGCANNSEADKNGPWPVSPWPFDDRDTGGDPAPAYAFADNEYFEGGVNLSFLFPEGLGCFTNFLLETRSSPSIDATLSDLLAGNFDLCGLEIEKSGDTLSKVGDDVTYTFEITNTGSVTLHLESLTDTVLGDISDDAPAECDELTGGETCSFQVVRTVQPGDADPLPNTVTAVYNTQSDLTGDNIDASDDHEVNLFQPSIEVTKTGTELSKVGDGADYTITISNTSSADSPQLVFDSVNDTLLGNLLDGANPFVTGTTCGASLASGASCTITASRTVQPGDPDPLPNTVTAHLHPNGFPNDITDSDDHSVNLFQPAVSVDKSCDPLSKVGDPVHCSVTITNDSSSDSPPLVNPAVSDTIAGNLLGTPNANVTITNDTCTAAFGGGFAHDESCVIEYDYIVQEGDPDPLPNTASATFNPQGFPNVIEGSSSTETNLFQPSITLDKTGDAIGKVGDPASYTITVTNTSSADAPALVFDSLTDTLLGNLLDPANPFVTGSTCGASLASGASCSVMATRTVQGGDPDPLPNTATVHTHPDGFPNDIWASDDHSVNLFQPSISVDKSGDTLGKVTDPANYTIVVTNTSSGDSPHLVFDSLIDTLLGDLLDPANPFVTSNTCGAVGATLAPSGSCTVTATRIVQAGDPDPLPNSATVHAHPAEFPNDITDSDDHSLNLFQPSVDVAKDGPGFSKIGDDARYTVTVTNTSSGDSPALVGASVMDNLAGNLLGTPDPAASVVNDTCTAAFSNGFSPGESCQIVYDYTVQPDDLDPLTNTVAVHFNPDGFPNDVADMDGHTIELFQPSVVVDKSGDTVSKVGDDVTYQFTITNTSSPDSPALVLDSVTDTVLGDITATAAAAACSTLAPAASCNFSVVRTVQPGDPDPLPNTVTVHYHPDGFPNDITDTDDHEVNLFQPSVTVDKSGDELSKVGDDVTYDFVITNTSSPDSPNLVLVSVIDTVLGNITATATAAGCASLAPGASCNFSVVRTVQAADPDPLPNTVTVLFNPLGFPNEITDSDDHSVNLFQPSVQIVKTGDTVSKVGDPVTYTFTITNTSSADSPPLVLDSITDTLLGDLSDEAPASCDTLAPGALCSFTATRTVQPGDPDPLPNTVTAHYHPQGFPNDITDSDDHSVNLFQPSVQIVKTGDTLSKIGDPVTYTFTVTNTSSADSPSLVLDSISDTLLGDLSDDAPASCDTLAPAASCSFTATRTVEESDPDPLPNTVTVHYHPDGFPNDITDSDDHSVNLFQPGVVVSKTGDLLSKVGDDVTYTFTITNISSADSPSLVLDSINDTLLGDLSDEAPAACDTLAPGASCSFTVTRTVQPGDPDPLPNTVTVHYHPTGFPNDITDWDDHIVELFQPSVTIDKTGDTLSKIGDQVTYTFTITNTSSADSPNLALDSITDDKLGNLAAAATAAGCASLAPGASCTFTTNHTVPAGSPDPLVNTVTVHYHPVGFPNDITASDNHSVNLFQPSIAVDKTGPAYTKAGDTNTYTVVVTNTSSADTPELVNGTLVDSLVGDLLDPVNTAVTSSDCDGSLTSGTSCTVTYTYVTQHGDPEPLVNNVVAHFNPDGFPNDITEDDSHSSIVVHPSFTVTKDCLTETVPAGGSAIFEITITNTGDIPLIFTTSENEQPGPFQLAPGGSITFEATVVAGSEPIVENTVVVTAVLPELYGLDNVLVQEASDHCDVLTGATRTPGFWQTHVDYTTHVFLDHLGGTIDLGWVVLDSPDDVFGMFWANNAKESDGKRRSKTCQAQVIGSFHLLAAILNSGLDNGASVPIDPVTGLDLITAMRNALASGNAKEIQRLIGPLDAYNNSGDDVAIIDDDGTLQGRADPGLAKSGANYEIADC